MDSLDVALAISFVILGILRVQAQVSRWYTVLLLELFTLIVLSA